MESFHRYVNSALENHKPVASRAANQSGIWSDFTRELCVFIFTAGPSGLTHGFDGLGCIAWGFKAFEMFV